MSTSSESLHQSETDVIDSPAGAPESEAPTSEAQTPVVSPEADAASLLEESAQPAADASDSNADAARDSHPAPTEDHAGEVPAVAAVGLVDGPAVEDAESGAPVIEDAGEAGSDPAVAMASETAASDEQPAAEERPAAEEPQGVEEPVAPGVSVDAVEGAALAASKEPPVEEHPTEPLMSEEAEEEAAIREWEPESQVSQDFDKTWARIEEAFAEKRSLSALVVDRVKGGLLVDIGVQGFVPASHVASGKVHDLEKYIGRTLKLRITDLDRERQRVVLSARIVQEEEHVRRKKETMGQLKLGMIAEGVVRRLTDFGAFVDIGGVDGLLHVSEMSWSRVKHPKEVVSPGDRIKVKVLKISDDKKKISLGMRQLLPDPWNKIESQYKVGDMCPGKVVRVVPFGAFVQVADGVEAILPNSEVSSRKPRPEELPQVGDSINAKVIELRPEARRMTLSIRRIQEEQDRKEYQSHVESQSTKKTTIGDLFGDILSDWQGERGEPDTQE